jgi:ABC-type transport system involved in cytochrome c biogenesis permease subunit
MSQQLLLYFSLFSYALAGITAIFAGKISKKKLSWLSIVLSLLGIISQIVFVITRAFANGFLPFASRFESMVLFALAVQLAGLILYLLTKRNWVKTGTDGFSLILLGVALFVVGFTPGKNLNPILNSPFFAFHILISFAGYGVIITGLAWGIVSLFNTSMKNATFVPRRIALTSLLLFGTGILIGSIWADNSWGTYWSWDPKESWALLNWAILMVYVHISRRTNRYWLASLFFGLSTAVMLFTFIGINLLRLGLHRY